LHAICPDLRAFSSVGFVSRDLSHELLGIAFASLYLSFFRFPRPAFSRESHGEAASSVPGGRPSWTMKNLIARHFVAVFRFIKYPSGGI
jgi:hypothetical protein